MRPYTQIHHSLTPSQNLIEPVDRTETHATLFWPDARLACALLGGLIGGDPLAPSQFAEAYLEPLIAFLRAVHRQVDDHTRQEAAERAIISLCKSPNRFDPARGDLVAYLTMSATGDLRNLLSSETRHHEKRENWDSVELDVAAGKSDDGGADSDSLSFDLPALAAVISCLSNEERAALELMREGERSTARFAAVLGLVASTPHEQVAEVKRVKDRIKQRLKRALEDGR